MSRSSSVGGEGLLPLEEDSLDIQRVSRNTSRQSSRRSSRAGSVSMDRNAQTQNEVDEATKDILTKPYGKALLVLAKELNRTAGSNIDLLELAAALEGENPAQIPQETCDTQQVVPDVSLPKAQFVSDNPVRTDMEPGADIRAHLLEIELNDRTI